MSAAREGKFVGNTDHKRMYTPRTEYCCKATHKMTGKIRACMRLYRKTDI